MILMEKVLKAFDGFHALDSVSLHAPGGAVYGLVGPNGAGKTTLIRCLTGVMAPDSGAITVGGLPVWESPAAKAQMAYISDDVFYFPAANESDMARYYGGVYPSFDRDRWNRLAEAFDLPRKPIRRMSRGMQKQAAFRLALALRPKVLVLDEPVDGLDPVMRRQVWSLVLADVAEHGTTVLVSSHNLRELEDVCDHVGVMDRGRLLLERSLSDLQDGVQKVQLAFAEGVDTPDFTGLDVLHRSHMGRVETLIIRGEREAVEAALRPMEPVFLDVLPLSLEEIFIYELGGADYAVKDILL